MRRLIFEAGFPTLKAFADTVGLESYELSRILSKKASRRPTGPQLRRLAHGLGRKADELASLLLPAGGLEQELISEVVQERDQLLASLSETRTELMAARSQATAAEDQVCTLGQELCERHVELERLKEQLAEERARAVVLRERKETLLAAHEREKEASRRLQLLVAEKEVHLTSVRENAAEQLAAVCSELQRIQDDRNRDALRNLEKQILAGTLGAAVGAIVTGAATAK